jgi:hypothetical protein
LNELHLSKAGQQKEVIVKKETSPAKPLNIRILNPGVSTNPNQTKVVRVVKRIALSSTVDEEFDDGEPLEKRTKSNESSIEIKSPTTSEVSPVKAAEIAIKSPNKKNTPKLKLIEKLKSPKKLPPKVITTPHEKSEEIKPVNKLLALVEVTPEQYDRLNKALTTDERNENITNIIDFMSNHDIDPNKSLDNGKYFIILI